MTSWEQLKKVSMGWWVLSPWQNLESHGSWAPDCLDYADWEDWGHHSLVGIVGRVNRERVAVAPLCVRTVDVTWHLLQALDTSTSLTWWTVYPGLWARINPFSLNFSFSRRILSYEWGRNHDEVIIGVREGAMTWWLSGLGWSHEEVVVRVRKGGKHGQSVDASEVLQWCHIFV